MTHVGNQCLPSAGGSARKLDGQSKKNRRTKFGINRHLTHPVGWHTRGSNGCISDITIVDRLPSPSWTIDTVASYPWPGQIHVTIRIGTSVRHIAG